MVKEGRKIKMLIPTIVTGLIALILLFIGYQKGGGEHILGLKLAGHLFLQIIPLLIFALVVAGMIQILIPKEMISKFVGSESGFRGILIGTVAGSLTPAGPFVSMPIAAGLLRTGAGIGTMVAFLSGWALIAVGRLPIEIGLLGWKFTLIRLLCVLFLPTISGLIAHALFRNINVI